MSGGTAASRPEPAHPEKTSLVADAKPAVRRRARDAVARLRAFDRAFWFLGPATYCHHEGERPMAVTWRLAVPLPGDLYAQFAAAVA